ncbi:MAG TPA: hypothetical protein VJV78_29910 [Polyangiales bacterium]|nr:hypothetical protein [Polyangiales bacterium]
MHTFKGCGPLVLAMLLLERGVAFAADPTTADCLNANERSIALRSQHQLRAARAELLVCAAPTCPEDIRNECARRVADVNAAMPTIVFEARDIRDNDLSAVAVSMDGHSLVQRLEGTALSIDPGEHQFVFSAQNVAPVQKTLIIREGEKGRREKVILGGEVMAPNQVAAAQTIQTPQPVEQADSDEASARQTRRIIGIAVGGAGIVSLSIALAEQLTALDRDQKSKEAAENDDPQSQEDAQILHDQAKQAQTYAIIFGSVGAVALGTGLYLLLSNLGSGDEPGTPPAVSLYLIPAGEMAAAGVTYARTF